MTARPFPLGELPLIAAPMAGGPTTLALARAVANAGAFPMLAAGYVGADALAEQIEQMREHGAPFGVNVFLPPQHPADPAQVLAYAAELAEDAQRLGVTLPEPLMDDDDHYAAKIELLLAHPVPAVSFTFGLPERDAVHALHERGTSVWATVTSSAEAQAAQARGVDALVVQGWAAGGHSAVHDSSGQPVEQTTAELVTAVRDQTELPLIAAGGVDGPSAVRELLVAGAQAVAVGTLLMRTPEAGTSAVHRLALEQEHFSRTVLTRAFTGRPARALANGFIERHDAAAVTAYPAIHHLTKPLRAAAAAAGDLDGVHLWAGTGWRSAREIPAAQVIADLARGLA